MKKFLFVVIVLAGVYYAYERSNVTPEDVSSGVADDTQIARAFEERRSTYQVQGMGTVSRVLSDDNDGSRHQRFIIRLQSGQTILVAHNIDLAPRIPSIRAGDAVSFYGEYEWNPQGGVIHWTHRDPHGNHVSGWLEHNGRRYQ